MKDEEEHLRIWIFISRCQFWIILLTVIISLLVATKALLNLLKRKKSNYFPFLICIVVANFISLLIILFDIFNVSIKGTIVCKLELFISNTAACFINWMWLCLFTQRFIVLFYPMKRSTSGCVGFLRSSRKLIIATLLFALITQSWSLIFIDEVLVPMENGQLVGVCERNEHIMNANGYKILVIFEAMSTYVFPFILTILTDIAVLLYAANSGFVVLTSENIRTESRNLLNVHETLKIQSSQSIKESTLRRQRAVRRCLLMATTQVLLNAPYYTLQFLDEIYNLRSSIIYLYIDAFLYFIYLTQFSMIYFYTNFLVAAKTKNNRSQKIMLSYTSSLKSEYTSSNV